MQEYGFLRFDYVKSYMNPVLFVNVIYALIYVQEKSFFLFVRISIVDVQKVL